MKKELSWEEEFLKKMIKDHEEDIYKRIRAECKPLLLWSPLRKQFYLLQSANKNSQETQIVRYESKRKDHLLFNHDSPSKLGKATISVPHVMIKDKELAYLNDYKEVDRLEGGHRKQLILLGKIMRMYNPPNELVDEKIGYLIETNLEKAVSVN